MSAAEPIIEFREVGVKFGSLAVHHDISFRVFPGESVTLLGPSGVGKTLILKMIMGLLEPSSGEVLVMGRRLSALDDEQLRTVRTQIGMVFQGAALFDSLNVFDNIAYGLREQRQKPEREIAQIVEAKLETIGLPGIGRKFPAQLSGGQKKRVGLARALASSPEIVLFDEPTTGLDPTAIRLIDELILKLQREYGITSLAVTHDIESARRISRRWMLINQGSVVADGPAEEIAAKNREVIDFITGNWRGEITLT